MRGSKREGGVAFSNGVRKEKRSVLKRKGQPLRMKQDEDSS